VSAFQTQSGGEPTETLNVIVSHGDCVHELPSSSVLLASSPSCSHEIFIIGRDCISHSVENSDGNTQMNILCCQSHPEFDLQYSIYDRILPAVMERKRLTEAEIEEAKATFKKYDGNDASKLLIYISSFLRL